MKSSSKIIATGVIAALLIGAAFAVSLAFAGSPLQAATTGTPGTVTAAATGAVAQATNTEQPTPVPPRYVRVWSSMCVEGVPYTLLSVPTDVKFALLEEPVAAAVTPGATLTAIAQTPVASSGTGTPQASTGTGTPQAAMGTGTPQASITGVPVTGAQNSLGVVPAQNSCTSLGTVSGVQLVMCTGPQASKYTLYAHGSQGTQTYMGTLWDCAPKGAAQRSGAAVAPVGPTNTPPVANTPTTPQPTSTP